MPKQSIDFICFGRYGQNDGCLYVGSRPENGANSPFYSATILDHIETKSYF